MEIKKITAYKVIDNNFEEAIIFVPSGFTNTFIRITEDYTYALEARHILPDTGIHNQLLVAIENNEK